MELCEYLLRVTPCNAWPDQSVPNFGPSSKKLKICPVICFNLVMVILKRFFPNLKLCAHSYAAVVPLLHRCVQAKTESNDYIISSS